MSDERPRVIRPPDVEPVPCPCGQAWRIITAEHNDRVSIHRVRIAGAARKHYHDAHAEYYVVLSGEGEIVLDDACEPVREGDVIQIPPRTRHALRGDFEILNVVAPPFDAADEHLCE